MGVSRISVKPIASILFINCSTQMEMDFAIRNTNCVFVTTKNHWRNNVKFSNNQLLLTGHILWKRMRPYVSLRLSIIRVLLPNQISFESYAVCRLSMMFKIIITEN